MADQQNSDARLRLCCSQREDWPLFRESEDRLFCAVSAPPPVGTPVSVDIVFVDGPSFLVRGDVVWRRLRGNAGVRPGVGVHVHRAYRSTVDFIDAWALGTLADRRRYRRLPVRLPVAYEVDGRRWMNHTRDLCPEGIFVHSVRLLEAPEVVKLRVVVPGGAPIPELEGHIVHRAADEHVCGVGILLRFSEGAAQASFATFVETLEQELLAGQLPRERLP